MGRAETRTLLPIDTFARILGVHPLHFNGVYVEGLATVTTCGQPLTQHSWQSTNSVSREDIAQAIADAEDRIAQYTRFKLAPAFESDERHAWPQTGPWWATSGPAIKTNWARLISAGIEARTVIGAGASIAYTDTDGDGYAETATITASTTVTNPDEIALFYPGEDGDWAWEIRPLLVSISGGVVTIRCRRELLVNPGLLEAMSDDSRAVDGLDDLKFLTNADVYRVWLDPQQQAQMLWEQPNWGGCGCSSASCHSCYQGTQFGCVTARDYRTGLLTVHPAVWNSDTFTYQQGVTPAFHHTPNKVRLWYRSGYVDQTQRRPMHDMKPQWARAVTYMAAAMLARPLCACQSVNAQIEHWMDDLAKVQVGQSSSENYVLERALLANPFGTSRGAIWAWKTFQREAVGEAVSI